jgi:hypothetical protein
MTVPKTAAKADAAVALAMGRTRAQAAKHAGVTSPTVKRWLEDVAFRREIETLRPVATRRPLDAVALLTAIEESGARVPGGPRVSSDGPGRTTVHLQLPPYATARDRRRIMARSLTRAIVASMEQQ